MASKKKMALAKDTRAGLGHEAERAEVTVRKRHAADAWRQHVVSLGAAGETHAARVMRGFGAN